MKAQWQVYLVVYAGIFKSTNFGLQTNEALTVFVGFDDDFICSWTGALAVERLHHDRVFRVLLKTADDELFLDTLAICLDRLVDEGLTGALGLVPYIVAADLHVLVVVVRFLREEWVEFIKTAGI